MKNTKLRGRLGGPSGSETILATDASEGWLEPRPPIAVHWRAGGAGSGKDSSSELSDAVSTSGSSWPELSSESLTSSFLAMGDLVRA